MNYILRLFLFANVILGLIALVVILYIKFDLAASIIGIVAMTVSFLGVVGALMLVIHELIGGPSAGSRKRLP